MMQAPVSQTFEQLPLEPQMKETLIRLPYRIGYWLSQSDHTGGDESDEIELQAMENLILSYGEDVCKSELTQSIMEKTVAEYEVWDEWRTDIEKLPDECTAAIYYLSSEVTPKHLNDFKETLFEIAETVALAYRETDDVTGPLNKLYVQIRVLQKKWDAMIKQYHFSLDHALNISPAEEHALRMLKQALRI